MRPFANSSERIYDLLDRGQKKKSAGRKAKKSAKVRQKRKFRAQQKQQKNWGEN